MFNFNRACLKSCITRRILQAQTLCLKEMGDGSIYKAFKEMDMPIQRSLLHMERNGMGVDSNRLAMLAQQISDHIGRIESEVFRLNGKRFPVNSSRDVAQALKICKKDGTQAKKCTRDDLMKCSNPMAKLILEHRSLNAILCKSIQPLAKKVINNRYFIANHSIFKTFIIPKMHFQISAFMEIVTVLQTQAGSQCMSQICKMLQRTFTSSSKVTLLKLEFLIKLKSFSY